MKGKGKGKGRKGKGRGKERGEEGRGPTQLLEPGPQLPCYATVYPITQSDAGRYRVDFIEMVFSSQRISEKNNLL